MYEQDYIMRLIKEMIRAILKLLFNIDTESQIEELLKDEESQTILTQLLDMVDNGNINEAENLVFEMTSEKDKQNLEVALLFYSYLNEKEDSFLLEHNFSRKEIQQGVQELASKYGLSGMTDVFLM